MGVDGGCGWWVSPEALCPCCRHLIEEDLVVADYMIEPNAGVQCPRSQVLRPCACMPVDGGCGCGCGCGGHLQGSPRGQKGKANDESTHAREHTSARGQEGSLRGTRAMRDTRASEAHAQASLGRPHPPRTSTHISTRPHLHACTPFLVVCCLGGW